MTAPSQPRSDGVRKGMMTLAEISFAWSSGEVDAIPGHLFPLALGSSKQTCSQDDRARRTGQ